MIDPDEAIQHFRRYRGELHHASRACNLGEALALENKRLRAALETATDLLCGSRSGHIGGSQPDCEWDTRKDKLLREMALIRISEQQPAKSDI